MTVIALQQPKVLNETIDEEEIILQAFGMDHPECNPNVDQFTSQMFDIAHDVLSYTNVIDEKLRIEVIDDEDSLNRGGNPVVSRDVLATYKTLLYRTACNAESIRQELQSYKCLSWALGAGILAIWFYSFSHSAPSFQQIR